jgi:hypothetical protein
VNCLGVPLLSWRRADAADTWIDPDAAERLRIETSVDRGDQERSIDADFWWLAAAIPFDVLEELSGSSVEPEPGTAWCGNFHQLEAGESGAIAVWNPIPSDERNLHQPSTFGTLRFA